MPIRKFLAMAETLVIFFWEFVLFLGRFWIFLSPLVFFWMMLLFGHVPSTFSGFIHSFKNFVADGMFPINLALSVYFGWRSDALTVYRQKVCRLSYGKEGIK